VAAERGAPLVQLDRDFHYVHTPASIGFEQERWPRVTVETKSRRYEDLQLGLIGEHQAANAAVAVAAVETLIDHGLTVSDRALAAGLAQVRWPARLEIVRRRPLVLLDCAHNVASVEALLESLQTSFSLGPRGQRWLIFAASKDKDLHGMLERLGVWFDRIVLTTFTSARAASTEELHEALPATWKPRAVLAADPPAALQHVLSQAGPDDLVCITGSVFLAGEMRPHLVTGDDTRAIAKV
jgi:dihydrofolate synthase/folylpolyglutamate synthase